MKDYSSNIEERKDFILGYDITDSGEIKIKFAKGKPWYVPYNEENEKIILKKMESQLENSSVIMEKLQSKFSKHMASFVGFFCIALIPAIRMITSQNTPFLVASFSLLASASLVPGFLAIKNHIKCKDLEKNIKFLEIKDKTNKLARKDQNILVNVSSKTKNVIREFPEDKEIFDINSFNYIKFKDLEQIIENADRNEKFGFNYEKQEEPHKAIIRKKVR